MYIYIIPFPPALISILFPSVHRFHGEILEFIIWKDEIRKNIFPYYLPFLFFNFFPLHLDFFYSYRLDQPTLCFLASRQCYMFIIIWVCCVKRSFKYRSTTPTPYPLVPLAYGPLASGPSLSLVPPCLLSPCLWSLLTYGPPLPLVPLALVPLPLVPPCLWFLFTSGPLLPLAPGPCLWFLFVSHRNKERFKAVSVCLGPGVYIVHFDNSLSHNLWYYFSLSEQGLIKPHFWGNFFTFSFPPPPSFFILFLSPRPSPRFYNSNYLHIYPCLVHYWYFIRDPGIRWHEIFSFVTKTRHGCILYRLYNHSSHL